jgi:hypothetical protein
MDITYSHAVVRYQKGNLRMPATIVFYAVSLEQASYVLQGLIAVEHVYDPSAMYAIRETAECVSGFFASSLYSCACGK